MLSTTNTKTSVSAVLHYVSTNLEIGLLNNNFHTQLLLTSVNQTVISNYINSTSHCPTHAQQSTPSPTIFFRQLRPTNSPVKEEK